MPRWDDRQPVDRIDPDAFLFTGADPAWTPAREFKLADAPDSPKGCCLLCGGDGVPLSTSDGEPVVDADGRAIVVSAIAEGSHRVCGRCMRSGRDQRSLGAEGVEDGSEVDEALPVACEDDPGYVSRNGVTVPERFARLMKG